MGRLDDIQTAIVAAVTVFFTNMHVNKKDFGFIENSFERGSTNNQKTRPMQSRIFKALCEDMGSTQTKFLLHTKVRWLSRGKVLTRMVQLRKELHSYFLDHKFKLADKLAQDNMPYFSRKLQYFSSQVDYHNFDYLTTLTNTS